MNSNPNHMCLVNKLLKFIFIFSFTRKSRVFRKLNQNIHKMEVNMARKCVKMRHWFTDVVFNNRIVLPDQNNGLFYDSARTALLHAMQSYSREEEAKKERKEWIICDTVPDRPAGDEILFYTTYDSTPNEFFFLLSLSLSLSVWMAVNALAWNILDTLHFPIRCFVHTCILFSLVRLFNC